MSELVIGVGNIVSPLCYSVIRLEPFSRCSFSCRYCYARWYWSELSVKPRFECVKAFESLVKAISKVGTKALPARLATLSEPFQGAEEELKISLKLLKLCLKYSYPVIINTKSLLLTKEPWLKVIRCLCDEGLVVIQVSIPSLNEDLVKYLEPNTPTVKDRLIMLKRLSDVCDALVVRLSPYIPRLSTYPSINELVSKLKEAGVKHVIAESLRIESREVMNYLRLFKEFNVGFNESDLEPYSLVSDSLLRFKLELRIREYVELAEALRREGITFATCKEGLFEIHTAPNCCGIHLIRYEGIGLRPTLKEVYDYVRTYGSLSIEGIEDVFYSRVCRLRNELLCRDDFRAYPKDVRKLLKYHERKLIKVLKDPQVLSRVSPNLSIEGDYVVVKELLRNSSLPPIP